MRSRSRVVQAFALPFVVGFVGYIAFGWRFDGGASSPLALALAIGAVALAVVTALRNR